MYCAPDVAENKIDGKDMFTFGQQNWVNLIYLNICIIFHEAENNNLGAVGCDYLSRAQMGEIQQIYLCIYCEKVGKNKIQD